MTPTQVDDLPPFACDGVQVAFSGKDGSVRFLYDTATKRQWVNDSKNGSVQQGLARFSYTSFSAQNFTVFSHEYTNSGDFQKQGMENAHPVGRSWSPSLLGAYYESNVPTTCRFVMQLGWGDDNAEVHSDYGAPAQVSIEYVLPGTDGAAMDISLVWTNKTATRLAESMWLSFVPDTTASSTVRTAVTAAQRTRKGVAESKTVGVSANVTTPLWSMDILAHPVSPLEVVQGGTVHKHCVEDGVSLRIAEEGTAARDRLLRVQTLDTALVSPGDTEHMLRYNDDQPDPAGGMHFNLQNNLWGTAFPQWYDDDGVARFRVYVS
jgi:hypothetical protein